MAGEFLAAAVVPAADSAGADPLLAGYAALAAEFRGQFAILQGAPATALTVYAAQHQVSELLLARSIPNRAGHHPVLRHLIRCSGDAEVHVRPAVARPERQRHEDTGAEPQRAVLAGGRYP